MIAAYLKLCEIVVWLGVHIISQVEGVQTIETQRRNPITLWEPGATAGDASGQFRGSSADESQRKYL